MSYNTIGSLYGGQFHQKGLPFEREVGFLVVMDLLGVKGIWKTPNYENHFTKWTNINYFIDSCFDKQALPFHKYCFSDTIIITIKSQNYDKSNNLVNYIKSVGLALCEIIQEAILNGLFFRGSINFGEYLKSSDAIIGPTIDDAAICYDKPEIIGIVASSEFKTLLDMYCNDHGTCYPFTKYDLPLKRSVLKDWWLLKWNYNASEECLRILESRYRYYANKPNIQTKYRNTLIFSR
jgi:hypothetical protein